MGWFLTSSKTTTFANGKKCVFGHPRIQYVGHRISSKGVEVNGEKVKAMVNWPQPKVVTKFCGFLGLTKYYRCFVKGFGDVGAPVTKLL